MSIEFDLEFSPGIPAELQKEIMQLLPAQDLISAYRMGMSTYHTRDIVLVVARHDTEIINAFPRREYVRQALNDAARKKARVASESAHKVARVPAETDAFWLVIEDRSLPFPVMCVLFTDVVLETASGEN
jgi:hypothetical protein